MKIARILCHLSIPNPECIIKTIVSFTIISICLFPTSKSDAEYHPVPEIIAATTEPTLEGNYYRLHALYYPDPYWDCHTAQEVADFVAADPFNWFEINEAMGPCKKCSSPGLWIVMYNGSEVCIGPDPCPSGTTFGNYYGEDGCIKCPDNYEYVDGLCRWNGAGPPPPPPPPTVPKRLTASTSYCKKRIISWPESNVETDYYVLERGYIGPISDQPPKTWKMLGEIESKKPPGTWIDYHDRDYEGTFGYRIKACNRATGQCSEYTPWVLGTTRLYCNKSNIHLLLLLDKEYLMDGR